MIKKKIVFLYKCILVMMPIICLALYAGNRMLAYADQEAHFYIWNRDFCTNTQEKQYDVIVLGDSVANAAYMPEILSEHTINLSLGGTTPMENYYTLKEYLAYNAAPEVVYISFMDYHLHQSDCFWKRSMYSHRYSLTDSWKMLQMAIKYKEPSIVTDTTYTDFLAYELYLPGKYITSLTNAAFNQRYEGNVEAYRLNGIHGGRYMARGNNEWTAEAVNFDSFNPAPLFDYYYKKLIELCLNHGSTVHIVKLPLPDTDTFSEEYCAQYNAYYNSLQKKYPDITVEWWDRYEAWYFEDQHHMNTHGALRFSTELKEKYREEFDNQYSDSQLDAISDNIVNENYISEMFKWVNCCPAYSLILYDGVGDFKTRYDKQFMQKNLSVSEHMFGDKPTDIYIVGSSDSSSTFDQIYRENGYLAVCPGDGSRYVWKPYDFSGISILVIDNYRDTIVCEKNFQLEKRKSFVLQ